MTDYNYGFELEVPTTDGDDDTPKKAKGDVNIAEQLNERLPDELEATWERIGKSNWGTEIRTVEEVSSGSLAWLYKNAIDSINDVDGVKFEPTGIFGDTTAGVHVHVSRINRAQAEELVEVSREPWLQVACCTSIFLDEDTGDVVAPVFRSLSNREYNTTNYCKLRLGSSKHYVVNDRGQGHYEWRLAEPMGWQNFHDVLLFLDRFLDGRQEEARNGLERRMRRNSMKFTAYQRAKALVDTNTEDWVDTTDATDFLINELLQ